MNKDNETSEIFTDDEGHVYFKKDGRRYQEIPISDEQKKLFAKLIETYRNAPPLEDMPFIKQWRERNK